MLDRPICRKCEHCLSVDIDGNIQCLRLHSGKEKVYCRDFKAKP
ncbi:MAG: hypothetical protein QXH03_02895 [Candidatus Bathyarchaeia archaeon]